MAGTFFWIDPKEELFAVLMIDHIVKLVEERAAELEAAAAAEQTLDAAE